MRVSDNILTVTYTNLTRSDNGEAVMSTQCYKSLLRRSRINVVVRGGGLGKVAEVEWMSLPDRFKVKYIAKYGDPEEAQLRQNSMITFDEKARVFFAQYELPDGSPLKEDKQQEYMVNASVLNKMLEPMRQRRHEFEQDIPEIYNILKKGTEAARETAAQTMDEVRKAMQIDYFNDVELIKQQAERFRAK